MTTYLKVMMPRDENLDSHPHSNFTLYTIPDGGTIHFRDKLEEELNFTGKFVAVIQYVNGLGDLMQETIPMYGNAYVLSESGKTVANHSS